MFTRVNKLIITPLRPIVKKRALISYIFIIVENVVRYDVVPVDVVPVDVVSVDVVPVPVEEEDFLSGASKRNSPAPSVPDRTIVNLNRYTTSSYTRKHSRV